MDIENLERLSCLKIDKAERSKIAESMNDLFKMIENLPEIKIINKSKDNSPFLLVKSESDKVDLENNAVSFIVNKTREKSIAEPTFNINLNTDGLKYNEEGLFEVVRVVHKKD